MAGIEGATGERLTVADIDLEVIRRGAGQSILLLHGMQNIDPTAPFLDRLSDKGELIAPSHPGFGHSDRPHDFDSIYDLVHLYLDVIESLPDEKITLMGFSFGGWLAAEIAVKSCAKLDRLILVDALGIKISGPDTPDILDVFNTSPVEVNRRTWHNPESWAPHYDAMTDDEIIVRARNWESLSLYGWHPYMYNPDLKRWLRRISCPTLLIWGAEDGIVSPSYGRAYSELIPGSEFKVIEAAGHSPEIEQPDAFAALVESFLDAHS